MLGLPVTNLSPHCESKILQNQANENRKWRKGLASDSCMVASHSKEMKQSIRPPVRSEYVTLPCNIDCRNLLTLSTCVIGFSPELYSGHTQKKQSHFRVRKRYKNRSFSRDVTAVILIHQNNKLSLVWSVIFPRRHSIYFVLVILVLGENSRSKQFSVNVWNFGLQNLRQMFAFSSCMFGSNCRSSTYLTGEWINIPNKLSFPYCLAR